MRAPLISFVIPCRNEGSALQSTIANLELIAGSIPHEVVLVDDASERPLSDALNDSQLRLVRVERMGMRVGAAKARLAGSAIARGQFLFHLDAHVCFSPGTIEKLLAASERHPGSILGASLCHTSDLDLFEACAAGRWSAEGLPLSSGWKVDLTPLPWIVPRPFASCEIETAPIAGAAALWMPAATYREIGGFFPGLGGYGNVEDTELCLGAWALGFDVHVLRDAVCLHYASPETARSKKGVSPGHEHPHYEGNALNAARVARLHLPIDIFWRSGYRAEDISRIACRELTERSRRLEARRKRSREEVLSLATESNGITSDQLERMLVCDSRSRLATLDVRHFERIACCSRAVLDQLIATGHQGGSMLAPAWRTLDDIYAYYRPEIWSRGFREGDFDSLDRLPADGRMYIEDAVLQQLAPYWYREDHLASWLSRAPARRLRLAIEDPLLDLHLRRFVERRGALYGVELEAP